MLEQHNGTLVACLEVPLPQAGRMISERTQMNTMILKLYVKFQDLMSREEGQDLVEYALVVALIALGSVATLKTLSGAIAQEFNTISTTFANSI